MFAGAGYAAGIRRGFVLVDTQSRLLTVVTHPLLPPPLSVANARVRSGQTWPDLASRFRKVLHVHSPGRILDIDTEYRTGTVWWGSTMLCSATAPDRGRSAGTWVDVQILAKMTQVTEDKAQQWVRDIYDE